MFPHHSMFYTTITYSPIIISPAPTITPYPPRYTHNIKTPLHQRRFPSSPESTFCTFHRNNPTCHYSVHRWKVTPYFQRVAFNHLIKRLLLYEETKGPRKTVGITQSTLNPPYVTLIIHPSTVHGKKKPHFPCSSSCSFSFIKISQH